MRVFPKSYERYITTYEAAKFLDLSESCLARLRWKGGGPPFHKLGKNGRVRYKYSKLIEWAEDSGITYRRAN